MEALKEEGVRVVFGSEEEEELEGLNILNYLKVVEAETRAGIGSAGFQVKGAVHAAEEHQAVLRETEQAGEQQQLQPRLVVAVLKSESVAEHG